jgi:sulfur transfer protein SufE
VEMTERVNQIKQRLGQYSDWEDRYKELIHLGKSLQNYPEDKRDENGKIKTELFSQEQTADEFLKILGYTK